MLPSGPGPISETRAGKDHISRLVPSEAVGALKKQRIWERKERPETPVTAAMALLSLSLTSTPTAAAMLRSSSSSAPSSSGCFAGPASCLPPQTSAFVVLPPLSIRHNVVSLSRRKSQVVRMAPEDEKMTRRSPLDFPLEWVRPKPGRRPDIFPQFSPMKTPLPPPLPVDPPLEDDEEEEEEEEKKEDEENPEKEESETPDGK